MIRVYIVYFKKIYHEIQEYKWKMNQLSFHSGGETN